MKRRRYRHNPLTSMAEIKALNKREGYHFFDTGTKKFFSSKIYPTVYGDGYFVTSEAAGFMPGSKNVRRFTVRQALPDGRMRSVSEFNQFRSLGAAQTFAKNAAATKANPRYGRRGRKLARKARRNCGCKRMRRSRR